MAVIGARPASNPWFGLRRAGTGRRRPPPARRTRRPGRLATRLHAPTDVRPFLVAIAIAAAMALFYLSQSTSVAARGYEVDALESLQADRRAEQQQLILDIGRARSPAVITREARFDLDLVPLDPDAVTFAPTDDESAH